MKFRVGEAAARVAILVGLTVLGASTAPAAAVAQGSYTFTTVDGDNGTTCPLTSFYTTGAAHYCGIPNGTPGADYLMSQGNSVPQGDYAQAQIDAPPGLAIHSITFQQVYASGVNDGHQWGGGFYWPGGGCQIASEGSVDWTIPYATDPKGTDCTSGYPTGGASYVGVQLICGASGGCTDNASIYVPTFAVTVTETGNPTLTAVGADNIFYQQGWIRGGGWNAALSGSDPSGVCTFSYSVNGSNESTSKTPGSTTWQECPNWTWGPPMDTASGGFHDGSNSYTVSDTNAAGNQSSSSTTLLVDNEQPGVSLVPTNDKTPGLWSGANHPVTVNVTPLVGPSGVSNLSCTDNGKPLALPNGNAGGEVTIEGNGEHDIYCTIENNAQNPAGQDATGSSSLTVNIDEQSPQITFSNAAARPAWNSGQPTVVATGSEAVAESGINNVSCTAENKTTGEVVATHVGGAVDSLELPGTGIWSVSCTATTGSGTTNSATEIVQVDDALPQISFSGSAPAPAVVDGAQLVEVTGSEQSSAPSGIQNVACSVDGIAQPVITGESGQVSVNGNGRHTVACQATTNAGITGPEASEKIDIQGYGLLSGLSVSPTARRLTMICKPHASCQTASSSKRTRAYCAKHRTRCKSVLVPVIRTTARCHKVGRRRRCRSVQGAARAIHLRWRGHAPVTGLLIVNGKPLPGASVQVSEQPTGYPARQLGTVTTNAAGSFTYTVRGPSGQLIFSYGGTPSVQATTAVQPVVTQGASTINVAKTILAWHRARISGQVLGGYIPSQGVLVQLWWTATGDPLGWQPVRAPFHTNRRGQWSALMRKLTPGHTYWFQVRISSQNGWPWGATRSIVLKRFVS